MHALLELTRDVFGSVAQPAFERIERDYAKDAVTGEQGAD